MTVDLLVNIGQLREALRELRRSASNILNVSKRALDELNTRPPLASEYPGNTPGSDIEWLGENEYPRTLNRHVKNGGAAVRESGEVIDDAEKAKQWRKRKLGWPPVLDQLNANLQEYWQNSKAASIALDTMLLSIAEESDQQKVGDDWTLAVRRTLDGLNDWCDIESPDLLPVRNFIQVLEKDGLPPWQEHVEALTDYIRDLGTFRTVADLADQACGTADPPPPPDNKPFRARMSKKEFDERQKVFNAFQHYLSLQPLKTNGKPKYKIGDFIQWFNTSEADRFLKGMSCDDKTRWRNKSNKTMKASMRAHAKLLEDRKKHAAAGRTPPT